MLGFFSFTEVTDPAAHRAYNEWHQLDHMPEQFSIEGITFGQRWVCSPRCLALRVAAGPTLSPCQYMTLYLLRDETPLPEFFALAQHLRGAGRFFEQRRSHLSGAFRVEHRRAAPRVAVSAAAIPFRPAAGIYVVVGAASLSTACDEMVQVPGVAGVWEFAEGVDADGEGRRIAVAWIDGELEEVAATLGQRDEGRAGSLEWAGPLERVDAFAWDWFE